MLFKKLPNDWKIITADAELSESQAQFDAAASTAMVPYRLPSKDLLEAPGFFTGYSYVGFRDTEDPEAEPAPVLKRVLPLHHPFWGGMWGARVNVSGEVAWKDDPPRTKSDGAYGEYDAYDEYRLEVFFGRRPYAVLPDGDVAREQHRFVEKLPAKPQTQLIRIEGGSLRFETPSAPGGERRTIVAPTTKRFPLTAVKWVWHQVPLRWALNPNDIATAIARTTQTVNDVDWEGYPKETLLLDAVDMDYDYGNTTPGEIGIPGYLPPRYLKITFTFLYHQFGWNCMFDEVANRWERVTYVQSGAPPYEMRDFHALFLKAPDAIIP